MHVSEAMHQGVQTIPPTMDVAHIAEIMREQDIGAVPVADGGRLVGMVTDRDLALRAVPHLHQKTKLMARDVMSPDIAFCHTEDRLEEAIRKMEIHQVRRLPVMNADNKIVGMLTIGDLSHAGGRSHMDGLMKSVSQHHS
ncbi:CBS domain-containing protein [Rhizobium sp. BK376]|uniref:CBS domain-containing protein n=1 Tax=Rhizobium sp. BK376 TaxID=2512149 RepID=UPI0010479619|nr:CBS domain-containing protein [Rhizobium sp. BK376]TCR66707.1 CBS domain-containing protein [Rhizobium sp. BK376]